MLVIRFQALQLSSDDIHDTHAHWGIPIQNIFLRFYLLLFDRLLHGYSIHNTQLIRQNLNLKLLQNERNKHSNIIQIGSFYDDQLNE